MRTYELRGWTFFESRVIDGKGTGTIPRTNKWAIEDRYPPIDPGTLNVIVVDKDALSDSGEIGELEQVLYRNRSAPCSPNIFCEQLDARQLHADQTGVRLFTSGKDQPFVKKKYRETYEKFLRTQVWDVSGLNVGAELSLIHI